MVDEGLEVEQTTAGEVLSEELTEMRRTFEGELEKLRSQKERARREHDTQLQEFLEIMEAEKRTMLRELESDQAALRADGREERRRMEQDFNDQLHRVQRERVERDAKMEELETRLVTERVDANARFLQESVELCNRIQAELEADAEDEQQLFRQEISRRIERQERNRDCRLARVESALAAEQKEGNKRWREAMNKSENTTKELKQQADHPGVARGQHRGDREAAETGNVTGERWMQEMTELCMQIYQNQQAQKTAGDEESKRLEARIQELEEKKTEKTKGFWQELGSLASMGACIVALAAL
ncbi:hypothetical protein ACHAQH_000029 [Verticillium albo-atrum]